ncbi:hypothetical protein HOH87_07010 [bacterium]|jgi:hypothetical protein|nr:hypothetical protein [bacterium]
MSNRSRLPVYGVYLDKADRKKPLSHIDFKFNPIDFIAHWQRCGATANYLAEFQAYNFDNRKKVTNIMSTVLNELIENAVKFSADAHQEASISIYNYGETLTLQCVNTTQLKQANKFEAFIKTLMETEVEELFLQQIMSAAEDDHTASGLGLITLKKDFNAKIGAKIVPDTERRLYTIYIKVVLDVNTLESL